MFTLIHELAPVSEVGTALFVATQFRGDSEEAVESTCKVFWYSWLLRKPRLIVFVEATPASELRITSDGVIEIGVGVEVSLQTPLSMKTHYGMAQAMLTENGSKHVFVLHRLSSRMSRSAL